MKIQTFNSNWNETRETKTLGWKTPNKVVEESFPRALAYLNLIRERYGQAALKPIKTITNSGYLLKAAEPKKTKKPTSVDRYLQYLDWETKKGFKSTLLMPTMFKNFSNLTDQILSRMKGDLLRSEIFVNSKSDAVLFKCHARNNPFFQKGTVNCLYLLGVRIGARFINSGGI